MTAYRIREAGSRKEIDDFIKVPFHLYGNNPCWVPQLISESRKILNKEANPFFLHAEAKYFVAYASNRPIARIAGILNHLSNEYHDEKVGFFGFFECPEDSGLAHELFDAAAEYVRQAGMIAFRGPANFSSNDDWGFLASCYDRPPVIMMPYNPPYYLKLAEECGFAKAKDLLAYYIDDTTKLPEKAVRIAEIVKKKEKIRVRTVDLSNFERELQTVRQIYNSAWMRNWGFVPMTEEEIDHVAADFKKILDPDIVFLAFVDDQPAGFSLALPDLNQVLRVMRGRLFPTGLARFIWHTKIRRSIHGIRHLALGVTHEFQKRGIDNVFYVQTYRNGVEKGYTWAELSWILEDNILMNRALLMIGAVPYKRYRIYEKRL